MVDGLYDAVQDLLLLEDGLYYLIFLVVGHFVYGPVDNGQVLAHVLVHDLEVYPALVHVVDQHPQLVLVLVGDPDDVGLGADDLVAGGDDRHLLDFRVRHCEEKGQVLLELLDDSLRVGVVLDVLDARQAPQALECHMRVEGLLGRGSRLEYWFGGSAVVGDCLSAYGGSRGQRVWDGTLEGCPDAFSGGFVVGIKIRGGGAERNLATFLEHLVPEKLPDCLGLVIGFLGKFVLHAQL